MLEFHPAAWHELEQAIAWYDREQRGLGPKFARAVREKIRQAERFPQSASQLAGYPPEYDLRRVSVRDWPYGIVLAGTGGVRLVIAVAHEKRRPGYWERRLLT